MIVLDSSFVVAFHNERDVHHRAAARTMGDVVAGKWGRALLLEYVFLEVVTVVMARRGLPAAAKVGTALLEARDVDFVPCTELFLDTFETFRAQGNTKLSFTDAAIVTAARRYDTSRVATFDRDFENINGITPVPEP
jgi:predicted nucleic acid-binding protein